MEHNVGLFRVPLNLQAIFTVTAWQFGPEIAEMNTPRADAPIYGLTHHRQPVRGNPRSVAPIHPQLLFGRHSEVCCFIRDDIGDAMVKI